MLGRLETQRVPVELLRLVDVIDGKAAEGLRISQHLSSSGWLHHLYPYKFDWKTMKAVTIPLLPCADIDEAVAFYEALGFRRTYRQVRPNPHAVVELGEIGIHLFGMNGFNPAESYGSTHHPRRGSRCSLCAVRRRFQSEIRQAAGDRHSSNFAAAQTAGDGARVHSSSIPVEIGCAIAQLGSSEEAEAEESTGLERVIRNAGRLADARGDNAGGLRLLQNGLLRFPEADALERVRALLYVSELSIRTGQRDDAEIALAQAVETDLSAEDLQSISSRTRPCPRVGVVSRGRMRQAAMCRPRSRGLARPAQVRLPNFRCGLGRASPSAAVDR